MKGSINMKQTGVIKSVVDPVCGMFINLEETETIATLEGEHYYFCAEGCRIAFVENPKKFLEPKCQKPKGLWDCYMARPKKSNR